MAIVIERKQTAFRLSTSLLNKLREAAERENRSLNNYVESVLMDAVFSNPNKLTLAAMKEARENRKRSQPIHCSYMDYISTDKKHISTIKEVQRLGIAGKHAGSKSTKKLQSRVFTRNKMLARYATAFNAMQRIEAQKDGENN